MNSLIYFLIWGGLFFLMMRFGCGTHVMGHGHGHSDGRDAPNSGALPPPPDKAVDPVCHMAVETPKAKFEADPPTYNLKRANLAPNRSGIRISSACKASVPGPTNDSISHQDGPDKKKVQTRWGLLAQYVSTCRAPQESSFPAGQPLTRSRRRGKLDEGCRLIGIAESAQNLRSMEFAV